MYLSLHICLPTGLRPNFLPQSKRSKFVKRSKNWMNRWFHDGEPMILNFQYYIDDISCLDTNKKFGHKFFSFIGENFKRTLMS